MASRMTGSHMSIHMKNKEVESRSGRNSGDTKKIINPVIQIQTPEETAKASLASKNMELDVAKIASLLTPKLFDGSAGRIRSQGASDLSIGGSQKAVSTYKFEPFDKAELQILGRKFGQLNKGMIKVDDFMKYPLLQKSPIISRVLQHFDAHNSGYVNFEDFITEISVFGGSNRLGVLKFAFKIFDMDRDGFISTGELFQVVKLLTGDSLEPTELQQLVDKTIIQADKDMDGKISFQEFSNMIQGVGADQKLVVMNL